jgi:hypothetical protein
MTRLVRRVVGVSIAVRVEVVGRGVYVGLTVTVPLTE